MNYYLVLPINNGEYCLLDAMPGDIEDSWYFSEGIKYELPFPDDAVFKFDDISPAVQVSDYLENCDQILVLSEKLKDLVEKNCSFPTEFFEVSILNHKKREVKGIKYYLANIIGTIDCVDESKTEGMFSSFNEGMYDSINKIYFDETKIQEGAKIFRTKSFPSVMIVSEEIKKMFEKEGITGIKYAGEGEELDNRSV